MQLKGRLGSVGVLLALVLLGVQYFATPSNREDAGAAPSARAANGWDYLRDAHERKRSKVWMEVSARVVKTLADDNEGSRHQRFLVSGDNGPRVLVAHNIDLAERVPVREGDVVQIRGRYEWNEKGGVLHWTHHDPRGNIQGGWIVHEGTKYH